MATVYIGNAVGDEHGKAKGGESGNQTGKELRIQPWYLNKKGWIVLRPIDEIVADKLAYDMEAACHNMNIGYDQGQRNTLYTAAKKVGFDCANVTTPCECDCSSLVRVCCCYSGVTVGNFNTASEVTMLMASGKFEKLTDAKYTESAMYLRKGDILVTAVKGHTAIVLNDGSKAHEDEPQPEPLEYAIRVKGNVYVREGNGSSTKVIGVARNCKLAYLGQAEEAPHWYKTVFNGRGGFITSNERYTELVRVEA